MTLGEKIKEVRKQAGMSQEELSGKLGVSRSAVAKWECDKGIPDVDNLKMLSQLFDVSIDYLLDNGETLDKAVIKESIDLSKYGKGSRKAKKDRIIREKYPEAVIHPLLAKTKLTKGEAAFDWGIVLVTDAPAGIPGLIHSFQNSGNRYYMVEQGEKQLLVLITDEFMVSRELAQKQHTNKFEIGNIQFTKCSYKVK